MAAHKSSHRCPAKASGSAAIFFVQAGEQWREARWQAQRNWKLCDAGVMICVLIIVGNVGINAIFRFAKDQGNEIGQHAAYGTETERLESAIEREAERYLGARDGRFDSLAAPTT